MFGRRLPSLFYVVFPKQKDFKTCLNVWIYLEDKERQRKRVRAQLAIKPHNFDIPMKVQIRDNNYFYLPQAPPHHHHHRHQSRQSKKAPITIYMKQKQARESWLKRLGMWEWHFNSMLCSFFHKKVKAIYFEAQDGWLRAEWCKGGRHGNHGRILLLSGQALVHFRGAFWTTPFLTTRASFHVSIYTHYFMGIHRETRVIPLIIAVNSVVTKIKQKRTTTTTIPAQSD